LAKQAPGTTQQIRFISPGRVEQLGQGSAL